MRTSLRFAIALAATLAVGTWALPAAADVDVFATLYKDKDVFVTIDVDITKNIDITVTQDELLDGAAEADVNINQTNTLNRVDDNPESDTPIENFGIDLTAIIGGPTVDTEPGDTEATAGNQPEPDLDDDVGSVNDNTGIVGVNQDVGNMVNQANNVAFAITDSESSLTHSEAWAEQINQENDSVQDEALDLTDADKEAIIEESVNDNDGIVGVNQNAGNNNNQANGVAMAVGEGSHVALAEAALGQTNTLNVNIAEATLHRDLIHESVTGNSGVVSVNQTVGNNNNQGSVTSFSALTSTVRVEVPGGPATPGI